MKKEIDNLEIVEGVNFEFMDLLKIDGTKYLLNCDSSCEEISNSKMFVDTATVGRHRGLSIIYIKLNLFHQSKIGRDVELQSTHIIFFNSPCDVMQVSTLSAQFGLRSELVDWNWDTTSVFYSHLLGDLSLRTDDRIPYCTNTASTPSKF